MMVDSTKALDAVRFDAWWKSFPISAESPEMLSDRDFAKAAWDAALAQPAGEARDAARLDFIAPGFRVLKGDHVVQVWWHAVVDGKTVAQSVVVPATTPNAVRAAIDAALTQEQPK